jgi:hypothetical protein
MRALLAGLVGLGACSGPTEISVNPEASFVAQVSGGVNAGVRGEAHFSTDAVGDTYGFALVLVERVTADLPDVAKHAIYLYRTQPGGPTAGEFRVIESRDMPGARETDFVGTIVLGADQSNGVACQADTGTVRLTPLPDGRLRGSFALSARCERMNGPGTDDPIGITGTFVAQPGVVQLPDVAPPAMGSYTLADVGGQPLPGTVSIGVYDGEWFETIATSGTIAINPTGHYAQTVMLESRTDGTLTGRSRWVDRGVCRTGSGSQLVCTSEYIQNVAFVVTASRSSIEVLQDIVGDGVHVSFRYRRAGP